MAGLRVPVPLPALVRGAKPDHSHSRSHAERRVRVASYPWLPILTASRPVNIFATGACSADW